MASFQAKTGWDRLKMREKKNHSYQLQANPEQGFPKKFQKLKNINMTSFQAKTRRERLRM